MSAPPQQQQPDQQVPFENIMLEFTLVQQRTLSAISACQVEINRLFNLVVTKVLNEQPPTANNQATDIQPQPQADTTVRNEGQTTQ